MIGHTSQIERLKKIAESGQLANAYLFTGLDGIGKKLVAKQFAASLLNTSFGRLENNSHPDFFMVSVDPEKKDITIDQMREMQGKLQMHAMEGKYKIVIIDEAERMNQAAANSALKILEEPPQATHFFLITSRPHLLLPTIVSRCQKVLFSPPPLNETTELIKNKVGCDAATAKILAGVSCGSIGLAVNFPVETLKEVTSAIQKMWGKISPSEILRLAEVWGKSETSWATLATILAIYRDALTYKMTGKETVFDSIVRLAPNSNVRQKLASIISAQTDLETTYNKQLMFEQLLFTLAN